MRVWIRGFVVAVFTLVALTGAGVAEEKRFAPSDVRAEFQDLYARLKASHFNLFVRRPQGEYDALYRQMLASFDRPMTGFEIRVRFQRFMAFGRIAHSRIDFPSEVFGAYRDGKGKIFPLGIRFARGRPFIAKDAGGARVALEGREIVALNGTPIDPWIERLGANVSADNPYMMQALLENRLPALLWLELGAADRFTLRSRAADGTFDTVVPARTREEIRAASAQKAGVLALDWDARVFKMMANGVGYMRPGPFYSNDPNATDIWDVTAFRAFIDGSFETLMKERARSLVVDLRDNPGGDNSFSDIMVQWFATKPFRFTSRFEIKVSEAAIAANAKRLTPNDADSISAKFAAAYAKAKIGDVIPFDIPIVGPRAGVRFGGRVFILINRHSYSNTVMVAALAQDYRFATIVGEETSDLASTYGAMEQFTLPLTGIEVGFPKAHIVRPSGDTAARGVVPDIAIETPIIEGADDPVLRHAVEIASGR